MNILITSASRKVGLVRAFQSALHRSGGGNVIAVDVSAYSPALYLADRRFLVPASNNPAFVDELLSICKRERVALIIPTRDEELPVLAESKDRFAAVEIKIMVGAPRTIQICADKAEFIQFCRKNGFSTPYTYESHNWHTAKFPLFVKPRFGKGANGARMVRCENDLHFASEKPEDWIVQEYVESPECTIDLLADFEGQVISAVPRLRELVLAGESYVSRTVNEPKLISEGARLARQLHLVGHNTIQCFWDGNHVKFIEVNPRFGGAAALGWAAGADTPMMLIRMMNGETVSPHIGQFHPNLTMLRFTEDVFLKPSALLSTNDSPPQDKKLTHSRSGAELHAVLFDLDNTLYPEEQFVVGGFRACANFLAGRFHVDSHHLLDQMLSIVRSRGRGKVFDLLLQNLSIESADWLPTLLQVYRSHEPVLSLFPEVATLLRSLKDRGLRLGLVTDGLGSMQRRKISALGLEPYMDAIVCTDELGRGDSKPSPVPFEVALNLLMIAPENAVYIADDVTKDFAGPNRLGMKSVQIVGSGLLGVKQKSPKTDRAFLPQRTAASLREALLLLDVLRE